MDPAPVWVWCGGVVCGGVCGVSMNFKSTTEPVDEYLFKTSTPSDQPQHTHTFFEIHQKTTAHVLKNTTPTTPHQKCFKLTYER